VKRMTRLLCVWVVVCIPIFSAAEVDEFEVIKARAVADLLSLSVDDNHRWGQVK